MWKNVVQPDRPQMAIWRTHIACWISKATYTHACCVVGLLIAFLLQQWLHERASILRYTYSVGLLNTLKTTRNALFYFQFFFVLYNKPTNAQLFHKLSHSYMFRHYRVILRQLAVSTLLSYTSMSKQSLVIQFKISHMFFAVESQRLKSLLTYLLTYLFHGAESFLRS
jgi:hypothetical protein